MNIAGLLPFDLNGADLVMIAAGLAVFLSVMAVWSTLLETKPYSMRIKTLVARRLELKESVTAPQKRQTRRDLGLTFMRRIVAKLKLLRTEQAERIAEKLAQAGWRSPDAVVVFLFVKTALPVALAVIAILYLYLLGDREVEITGILAMALGCVIAGYYLPEIYVKNAKNKRREALRKGLPDALDLMVICAEAGQSLDAILERTSREMVVAFPELADELGLTAVEISFLPERKLALENLIKRVDQPDIRAVVNTLAQTEKYGTPLAQSLRVLAAEFRDQRLMRAEEKAARLPATMTVPLVIFILPALFVVLIGPAIVDVIDQLSQLR